MENFKFTLTTLSVLICTAATFAQRTVYFTDYAEVPPESNYRSGYIVTLKSDTIYGRLRNTESLGSILAPKTIRIGSLDVILKNGGALPKIAFIPELAAKSEQIKYMPENIKAFGYLSSYFEQQIVDLGVDFDKNETVKNNAFKIKFALQDPDQDVHLLQRAIYDRMANFESKYVAGYGRYCFLQRIAKGKVNLYYDTEHDQYYVNKPQLSDELIDLKLNYNTSILGVFGDSRRVITILNKSPEMKQPENLLRLIGIYNLEAKGILDQLLLKDFIITVKGDTLKGTLQMKGLSNLMLGMLGKVKLTSTDGQSTDMQGGDINRIVKYINNIPIFFDAYSVPTDGKRLFYQLMVNGKLKLYYDARNLDHYNQKIADESNQSVGSYLLVANGQPVVVSRKNFEEQADKLFSESLTVKKYTEQHPEKKQYSYLQQLVAIYNSAY